MASPAPLSNARRAGLAVVFVWFFVGGVGHFASPGFFIGIVPPYISWPRAAVYVSGACELAGAAGILLPAWRRCAGIGLFALTIAVTPANIFMLQHAEQFPAVPVWALVLRLPVQLLLLADIAWSTGMLRRRN